ncbi:MAG: mechanosensitive ion channel family protein [Actinomycetota bacterium]|nr:mechanosensitive ion channel family protein [Actinomycetota bacterium]
MEESFLSKNGDLLGAIITVTVAFVLAYLVDRIVLARGGRLAGQVTDGGVSRAAATRLRVVRRLVFVLIVMIGIGLALGQFTKLEKIATGLLASSAVLGIVLGLAARQVLANPLAGILLAITQPIRIGDTITFEENTGRVDDLTLSYTYIDTGDGRLMVVPNEQVVTTVLFNRSTGDQNAPVAASVWLPPGGDIEKARAALAPLEASDIETAEITPEGVRLVVHGPHGTARTSVSGEEAALRERAHQLLMSAGVLASNGE